MVTIGFEVKRVLEFHMAADLFRLAKVATSIWYDVCITFVAELESCQLNLGVASSMASACEAAFAARFTAMTVTASSNSQQPALPMSIILPRHIQPTQM